MQLRRRLLSCLFAPGAVVLAACGDSPSAPGSNEPCGPGPLFTVLPVAPADFDLIAVVGGLGAPGHTLPTAHSGFGLSGEGAEVTVPGDMIVTELRRVVYLESPNREGETDYAVNFSLCRDVEGWFGHLTSLPATILDGVSWRDCTTYSTPGERIQNCFARPRLSLHAGEPLGTGGLSIALGLMGLDFGLLDYRVNHFYVSRWRFPLASFHAVCPYEYFDAANQAVLFSKLRDPSRSGITPVGEPRCGTLEVDVAGTAKGVWGDPAVTAPVQGDERRYITLANYPYRPQQELALSLGPEELGARVVVTPRNTTGRVNRAFDQISGDGLIYCYESGDPWQVGNSWFLSLGSNGRLRVQWIQHASGASPCDDDPATWSFGAMAMELTR